MTIVTPTSWALEGKFDGTNWVDFTTDVEIANTLTAEYGIRGNKPLDLLGDPGNLDCELNNGASNSGGVAGYYSIGHASCRAGFADGLPVRLKITYGGTTRYKFYGWLKSAPTVPGTFRERLTHITAEDWMAVASRAKLHQLSVQTSKRADQIVPTIVSAAIVQPPATSYATCQETFLQALDTDQDENDTLYSVLGKLARSELGPIYVKGDTSTGGVLRVENRHYRLKNFTVLASLSNIMDGLELEYDRDDVTNLVRGSYFPRNVDTSYVVVATVNERTVIGPGQSVTLQLKYVDPAGKATRISSGDVAALTADTDYKFGSSGDGSTNDMNASLGISSTIGANSAKLVLTNNHATQTGYVNMLQLRAKGIYIYEGVTYEAKDTASINARGEFIEDLQFSYVSSYNTIRDFTEYYRRQRSVPLMRVKSISFLANKSDALMTAALDGEPSGRITLTESQSGISADFFINGVRLELGVGGQLNCTWTVVPANAVNYWILGDATYGLLGVTTVLGF